MEQRCLIGVFRQIAKDLDKQLKIRIRNEGLPILVTHIPLFYILPESGESIPFNDLSNEWEISKSSLSDLVKRYEELDLIYREDSQSDKRVVNFGMTDKGIEIKNKLIMIEDDLLMELMKDLEKSERALLETMLKRIG